jgi:hypothetical protein
VAIVRASCPTCGDVKMTTRDVQVQVGYAADSNSYSFLCPSCRLLVNKTATEVIMQVLVGAGVRIVSWSRPAELDEPKIGPPITHDDLLGFHFALDEDRWLETQVTRMASADPRSRTA